MLLFLCVFPFWLVTFEDEFASVIPFASLIAVMTMGIALQQKRKNRGEAIVGKIQ